MKRWILTLCALVVALSAVATPVHAARMACRRGNGNCRNQTAVGSFVDADKDGICDHKAAANKSANFVDADNDGVCDNQKTGNQTCNFVDADNDGVCDNRGSRASGGRGRYCGKNR